MIYRDKVATIDDKIAGLRGWRQVIDADKEKMQGGFPFVYKGMWIPSEKDAIQYGKFADLPQWSISLTHAWLLWSEFPNRIEDTKTYIQSGEEHSIYLVIAVESGTIAVIQHGATFPDAVAKAWVEWKEKELGVNKSWQQLKMIL